MSKNIDVFISYKREERGITDRLIAALTAAGFIAVTDLNISKNEDFGDAIDTMIRRARMTIVLWTGAAANSEWVRKEAKLALKLDQSEEHPNHYLGVLIEDVDIDLPLELQGLQAIVGFPDGLTDAKLDEIVDHVGDMLGRPAVAVQETAATTSIAVSEEFQLFDYARSVDVVPAYQKYIDAHPDGEFVGIALDLIDKRQSDAESRAFALAREIDTLAGYEAFLREYPGGTHDTDSKTSIRQFKRWYFYPFRRGNLGHTLTTVSVFAAIFFGAMQLLDKARPPVDLTALQQQLTASQARVAELDGLQQDLTTKLAEAETQAASIPALRAQLNDAETRAENLPALEAKLQEAITQSASVTELESKLAETEVALSEERSATSAEREALEILGARFVKERADANAKAKTIADLQAQLAQRLKASKQLEAQNDKLLNNFNKLAVQEAYAVAEIARLKQQAGTMIPAPDCVKSGKPGYQVLPGNVYCIPTDESFLGLEFTVISDLSPLRGLQALETLYLYGTQIRDLSPLNDLAKLQRLSIAQTPITDLTPLQDLRNLEYLSVRELNLPTLLPISRLPKLTRLVTPDGKTHKGREAVLAAIHSYNQSRL